VPDDPYTEAIMRGDVEPMRKLDVLVTNGN